MSIKWNLRELFWVAIILALLLPYFPGWFAQPPEPLHEFLLQSSDLQSYANELDASAVTGGLSGGSGGSSDISENHLDMLLVMKNSTGDEMFDHLVQKIHQRMDEENWQLGTLTSSGNHMESFRFSKGDTTQLLTLIRIPLEPRDANHYEEQDRQTLRVLLIQNGQRMQRGTDGWANW